MTNDLEFKYKCLRAAVQAMREKQKLFFATKNQTALRDSKELERHVDKLLETP